MSFELQKMQSPSNDENGYQLVRELEITSPFDDMSSASVYPATMKERLYKLLNEPFSSKASKVYYVYMSIVVLLSTLAICLETLPSLTSSDSQQLSWQVVETTVAIHFIVEYLLKLYSCPNKKDYVMSIGAGIELASFLPFLIEVFLGGVIDFNKFRGIRVLRLVRVFRFMSLGYRYKEIVIFGQAIRNSMTGIMFLLYFLLSFGILSSSAFYYAETSMCTLQNNTEWIYTSGPPEILGQPCEVQSIVGSLWWCIVTIATVGYGDVVPKSVGGKVVAAITMLCGLIFMALPVAIVGANLNELYYQHKMKKSAKNKLKKERTNSRHTTSTFEEAFAKDSNSILASLETIQKTSEKLNEELQHVKHQIEAMEHTQKFLNSCVESLSLTLSKPQRPKTAPYLNTIQSSTSLK